MKAKPYKITDTGYIESSIEESTHLMFETPGPISTRILPIQIKGTRAGTGNWTWNGDVNKPTLKPSLLSKTYIGDKEIICHTFITDGKVIFLDDCTHELVGQTLDLLDIEEEYISRNNEY